MKTKLFLACNIINVLLLLVNFQNSNAQNYAIENIPSELKKDANAIVRVDDLEFRVLAMGLGVEKVKIAVTILNEEAKSWAKIRVFYNDLRKLNYLKARIYDAHGNEIRKIKKSEFGDYAAFDGFSLYSDSRFKRINIQQSTYPYTIEYEYEIRLNGLLHYPGWVGQSVKKLAVERSTFKVITPKDLPLRYKLFKMDPPAENFLANQNMQYFWEVSNLKAIRKEPLGPELSELIPRIIIAPTVFEIEGYTGAMSTWEDIGRWQSLINQGRNDLPIETQKMVRELTKSATSQKEKIKIIY